MALKAIETWESGEGVIGKDGSDEYSVFVYGDPVADQADNEQVIMPFAIPKFSLLSWSGHTAVNFARKRLGPGHWLVTASYRSPTTTRQTNDASFHFCTGGGTQHITCSRRTIKSYGATDPDGVGGIAYTPPDCRQSINNTGDDVAGTDIFVPTFDFKITFYSPPEKMVGTYVQTLRDCTAHFNSDPVLINVDGVRFTCQPGELLFLNAEGSKRQGFSDWEFTLNFKTSANIKNQDIGPIKGISARGWDYLWVRHTKQKDAASNTLVSIPEAAYVEEVYTAATLSPLILPTSFGQTNSQFWSAPTPDSGAGVS